MYILKKPSIVKSYCNHLLRIKYAQNTKKKFAVCQYCGYCFEGKD